MAQKTQIVIMAEPEMVTMIDTLRIVMGCSRAEVLRQGLEPAIGMAYLLEANSERLDRLQLLAGKQGMTVAEYVQLYAEAFSRKTYGATLEALESGRVTLTRLRNGMVKVKISAGSPA
jgi:hypothetical protein